jgi:two-component system sensor histidine kinase MprB
VTSNQPTGSAWTGLHYRRSLASRVTLLTTVAVGFAVSIVAFAAYATVRTQSINSLDESLRSRATQAASTNTLDLAAAQQVPPWALGAADVKILIVDATITPAAVQSLDVTDTFEIGAPEIRVARGFADTSERTVWSSGERWRVVAVQAGDHQALVLAQSLESTDRMLDRLGLVMLLFGIAGMIIAGLAGWGVARNGLRPVRRLTASVEDISRTQRL